MASGSDWIKRETQKRLKALQAKNPAMNSPNVLKDVEFITFTVPNKSMGRTESGVLVKTIPQGRVGINGWGVKYGDSYIVSKETSGKPGGKPKSDDAQTIGYFLYSDGTDYWVRKLGSRDFYKYTPPTVSSGLNTFETFPAPLTNADVYVGRYSSSFFGGTYFNYSTRIGGLDFSENPDLQDGEINVNWAFVSPTFTVNEFDEKVITNEVVSSGSYTMSKSSVAGCPTPNQGNIFVFSDGYTDTESGTSTDKYSWTTTRVNTFVRDTDLGSISQYNSTYEDYRTGITPQNSNKYQQRAILNKYSSGTGTQLDIVTTYLEANYPFDGKVLSSEVVTYSGTYTTVFSETYGPDEDNLTTTLTPKTGEWEMTKTISYSYATSVNDLRTVTITTTYAITKADLLTYTPLGVGQAVDRLNSGGPLGAIDLVTNPSPPFGYLTAYCHGPCELECSDPRDSTTPLYYLTDSGEPTYIAPLLSFETTQDYLDDLPLSNFTSTSETQGSYYSTPLDLLECQRGQRKLLTITNIANGPSVVATRFFDFESHLLETAEIDTDSSSISYSYNNVSFGGAASYSASFSITLDNSTTSINSETILNTIYNPIGYFSPDFPATSFTTFKTTPTNGVVGTVSANKVARTDYSFGSQEQQEDDILFPFSQWYVLTDKLGRPVDQFTVFDIPNNSTSGGGEYKLTLDSYTVQVLRYTKMGSTYLTDKISNWIWNTQTMEWVEGKKKEEDFSEIPLPFPATNALPIDYTLI